MSLIRNVCWSPMGHVDFRWVFDEACLGLQSSELVSDEASRGLPWVSGESPIRHVGFRWVFDQAFWSPMNNVEVYDQAYWSPMGLRLVSDGPPIIIIFL